jgi:hypothetical protein
LSGHGGQLVPVALSGGQLGVCGVTLALQVHAVCGGLSGEGRRVEGCVGGGWMERWREWEGGWRGWRGGEVEEGGWRVKGGGKREEEGGDERERSF